MRISLLPRLLPHHIAQCSSNAAHSTRSPSHVVCAHVAASLAVLLAGQANTGRYIDGCSTQACRETHGRCETDSRETHETHGHETHGRETHGRERPTAARDPRPRETHGRERLTAARDPRQRETHGHERPTAAACRNPRDATLLLVGSLSRRDARTLPVPYAHQASHSSHCRAQTSLHANVLILALYSV